ncbi:DUF4926 domain-containing protein [cf. Phormidesmis sp. LEGE 11477]|uniref:DUF4926 domain-containing protein n=1 Tax=cf. Phormidesmis sp. LEGE 11477 TaxID=1828680 RepID=UPI00187F663B|nr:DUF4926 domain-containing protein [cf. Phormidesmis sp. LEGE 11477]MBE9064348.1 DUF4926 domain-containing protein [cf. Phormidesmis sp. LEGE 11477]
MISIQMHDVVALLKDTKTQFFPNGRDILLKKGQIGTVVEEYNGGEAFEVEFSDNDGQAYAMVTLKAENLMVLYDQPVELAIAS